MNQLSKSKQPPGIGRPKPDASLRPHKNSAGKTVNSAGLSKAVRGKDASLTTLDGGRKAAALIMDDDDMSGDDQESEAKDQGKRLAYF
jgi:hypothetical protein